MAPNGFGAFLNVRQRLMVSGERPTIRLSVVVSKNDPLTASPALRLAQTAVASGEEAHVFFTADGLRAVEGRTFDRLPSELHDAIRDGAANGVHMHACRATMSARGVTRDQLIPEVEDVIGVRAFLERSARGHTVFM